MHDYLPMNVSRGSSGDNPRTLMMESSSDETCGCDIPDCTKTNTVEIVWRKRALIPLLFSFIINRQWWHVWTVHVIEVSDIHQSPWSKPSICWRMVEESTIVWNFSLKQFIRIIPSRKVWNRVFTGCSFQEPFNFSFLSIQADSKSPSSGKNVMVQLLTKFSHNHTGNDQPPGK